MGIFVFMQNFIFLFIQSDKTIKVILMHFTICILFIADKNERYMIIYSKVSSQFICSVIVLLLFFKNKLRSRMIQYKS